VDRAECRVRVGVWEGAEVLEPVLPDGWDGSTEYEYVIVWVANDTGADSGALGGDVGSESRTARVDVVSELGDLGVGCHAPTVPAVATGQLTSPTDAYPSPT
jgi:hypothetical protein